MVSFSDRCSDFYNHWHFVLWERRGQKIWRRVRRLSQFWCERFAVWRQERTSARREREECQRAEERTQMETQALQRAQVKSLIGQLDESFVQALDDELYEKRHDEFLGKARAELTPEYEDELERERERFRDEAAERRRQLDDELENELDRGRQQIRREERERVEEQLEMLKAQSDAANTANDHTSTLLVTLVKQLFPKKYNYLYDIGLRELSLMDLNRQLAPHGVAIVAQYRESTRQVRCQLANGHWAQRTVFSLVPAHEADEDEDATVQAEAVPDGR